MKEGERITGFREDPEVKHLGAIKIERTPEGRITRINDVPVEKDDKVVVVQRHQRPKSFTKEELIATAGPEGGSLNLDYTYNPATTVEGTEHEKALLGQVREALGEMDVIAATPRKRGAEHKPLLQEAFPGARQEETLDHLLDDSEIGVLGESFYGGYRYDPEEAARLFNPVLVREIQFGRGPKDEKKPFSYTEAWVALGYLPERNHWKVDSPEDLTERTEEMLGALGERNYLITHEANAISFHMLAKRTPEYLADALEALDLPKETHSAVQQQIETAKTLRDLYLSIKETLTDQPVPGFHYKKALTGLLEQMRLTSGGGKGYGAVSIYTLHEDREGTPELREAAYDQAVE